MTDTIEETVHDKTPGLINPENYVLRHKGLSTYLVLNFTDLNETQIYKMQDKDGPHHEIEILMSFNYLNLCKPNEHTEDYYKRGPNDEIFLCEIENKKCIYVGENLVSFETNGEIVKYSSELGFNDVKVPFAYSKENIYFMLNWEGIPFQQYETSTEKNEYQYLFKKVGELKGDIITDENTGIFEYGNDLMIY